MKTAAANRRIVILAYPQVRELDIAGVLDVFKSANFFLPPERHYHLDILRVEGPPQMTGMMGMEMVARRSYTGFKERIDTLILPGGIGLDTAPPNRPLLGWLRKQEKQCRRVGSVCTGAFFLAQAGILDGKTATTHWAYAAKLAEQFPAVRVDPDPIWTRDGNIYSSAGATSGIDLCLAMVEEDHGRKVALDVARSLVVFLCRPGNQAQFSASLREQSTEHRPLRDLQIWMLENLKADLSITALASRVAMSERNFQRVFTREIGKAPAHYVEEIRIEAVRRKLERSTQGLEEIASACGFNSADVMSRSFQRQLKTTPADYRARFRSSGILPEPSRKKLSRK